MKRSSFFVPASVLCWLLASPACGGNVVIDTGSGPGGSSSSAGSAGFGGDFAGSAGFGGDFAGTGGDIIGSPTCNDYCTLMAANCLGELAQYASENSCQAVCAHFAPGDLADTQGDTLGCREYHAGAPALNEPKTHCPHAGPLGGGVCSESDCSGFCKLAMAVCGGQAQPPYQSEGDCLMSCATYPGTDVVPYNSVATSGNSLACRTYHLTIATSSPDAAKLHCPHIASISSPCQ